MRQLFLKGTVSCFLSALESAPFQGGRLGGQCEPSGTETQAGTSWERRRNEIHRVDRASSIEIQGPCNMAKLLCINVVVALLSFGEHPDDVKSNNPPLVLISRDLELLAAAF